MTHRVLIVSPHFPPINAADHQRIRMSLPYFSEFGWEPHILTVEPDCVEAVSDRFLARTLNADLKITRTRALPLSYTRKVGLGSLGLRCLPYFKQAGDRLLSQEKFDLVYFSTTAFPVMALGKIWCDRLSVPYILDFQDPWLSDYQYPPGSLPPGGWLKYGFSQAIARVLEPMALRGASHAIAVSPEYPKILLSRYSWLQEDQFTVLPFGAAQADFDFLTSLKIKQNIFDPADGKEHWVYVGRGGYDMAFAARSLFQALATAKKQEIVNFSNLRLHFIGTDYAPPHLAQKTIEPLASEFGLAEIVTEHPARISYFEALQCLMDAHALIVLGSDDSGYTASKIYPYILAQKPLLAIFHEKSSVVAVLKATKAGTLVTFKEGDEIGTIARAVEAQWLRQYPPTLPATDWAAFTPYSAREMTRQQCDIFNTVVSHTNLKQE
jgi:hypothetical protein